MTWAPQFSRETSILRVPASLRGHAREVLLKTLPPALEQMTGAAVGDRIRIDIQASEEVEYDDGSTGVEPGYVALIGENLTDLFSRPSFATASMPLRPKQTPRATPGPPGTKSRPTGSYAS